MAITITGTSIIGPGGTSQISRSGNSGLTILGNYPTTTLSPLRVTPGPNIVNGAPSPSSGQYGMTIFNNYNPGGFPAPNGVQMHAKWMSFRTGGPTAWTPGDSRFSSPWENQTSQGSINTTTPSSTNFATSSDHRLKENVTPVENGLDYIMPLRPRKYTWKNTGYEGVGFIAHELEEDFPPHLNNIVNGEKDNVEINVNVYKDGVILTNESDGTPIKRPIPMGDEAERLMSEGYTWVTVEENPLYQSIDTVGLISPLVSSIQQLKKLYDAQQVKINELKVRVLEMEKN
jgi:hypothetical protein